MVEMNKIIQILKGAKSGSGYFGIIISGFFNSILLGLVYFIILAPTSIAIKCMRINILDETTEKSKTTWKKIKPLENKNFDYRQF